MTKAEITEKIKQDFKDYVEIQELEQPEPFIYIAREKYIDFCRYLIDDPALAFP